MRQSEVFPFDRDGVTFNNDSPCFECGVPYNFTSPDCPAKIRDLHPRVIINSSNTPCGFYAAHNYHHGACCETGRSDARLAETCPVCGSLFLPAALAQHVDNHLRRDSIELRLGGSRPGLYIGGYLVRTAGS